MKYVILNLILCLTAALSAAEYSLQVSGKGCCTVFLPLAWRSPQLQVTDIQAGDEAIGWRAIRSGGVLSGLCLDLPAYGAGCTITLSPDSETGLPDTQGDSFTYVEQVAFPLHTRPFSAEEMFRLFGLCQNRKHLQIIRGTVQGAGSPPSSPNSGHNNNRRRRQRSSTVLYHWSSAWHITEPGEYRFGSDNNQLAWTILVDGAPVSNWRSAEWLAGNYWGNSIFLTEGYHSLQFLAVQNPWENLPRCLFCPSGRENQGSEPPEQFSLLPPEAVTFKSSDWPEDLPPLFLSQSLLDGFCTANGHGWSRWHFRHGPENTAYARQAYVTAQSVIPGLTLEYGSEQLEWPAVSLFQPQPLLNCHLQWLDLPPMLFREEQILSLHAVPADTLPGLLSREASWHWEFIPANKTSSGIQGTVKYHAGTPFSLQLSNLSSPQAGQLRVSLCLDEQPVCQPAVLNFLEPASPPESGFQADGLGLTFGGQRCLLLSSTRKLPGRFTGVNADAALHLWTHGEKEDYKTALQEILAPERIQLSHLNSPVNSSEYLQELTWYLNHPQDSNCLIIIESRWLAAADSESTEATALLACLAEHFCQTARLLLVILPPKTPEEAKISLVLKKTAVLHNLPVVDLHSTDSKPEDPAGAPDWQAREITRQLQRQGWTP